MAGRKSISPSLINREFIDVDDTPLTTEQLRNFVFIDCDSSAWHFHMPDEYIDMWEDFSDETRRAIYSMGIYNTEL